jgi:hypothetical protein
VTSSFAAYKKLSHTDWVWCCQHHSKIVLLAAGVEEHGWKRVNTVISARTKATRRTQVLTAPNTIQQTNQGIESLKAEEGGKVE